jgi:hypothetical protein
MAEKEYIERDAALAFQNEVEPLLCRNVVTHDIMSATKGADMVKYLQSIPAADVRHVVMCKDCGHWNKENQHPSKRSRNSVAMCAWFSRNYGTIETSEGDWCSYGYRRDES